MVTNNAINIPTGASGTILRGAGVGSAPTFSTATYPSTAGTSGNVLTSDGTNWNSSTPSGVGSWVLIQSQNASNSASLTFTTGITSTYNTYVFVVSNYSCSTTNQALQLQVSSNGGSSYATSGYAGGFVNVNFSAGGTQGASVSVTTYVRIGGQATTTQPFGAATVWCYNVTNGQDPLFCGTNVYNFGAGQMGWESLATSSTTTTVNAFKFISTSGNLATGTFSLYGVRES